MERVDFEFNKSYSKYNKGDKMLGVRAAFADRLLKEKVGKILKPTEDKAEPKAKARAAKAIPKTKAKGGTVKRSNLK